MRSALVLALVGCGSSQAPAPTSSAKPMPAPSTDAAPAPPDVASEPTCPTSHASAAGACSSYTQWCEYAEGTCACTYDVPEHCGGARLPPPKPGTPTVWKCTPKPPEVRADGCPGVERHGQPCSDEGKQCTYESCCFVLVTCHGGRWEETKHECPP
jgi:hypothetical protein